MNFSGSANSPGKLPCMALALFIILSSFARADEPGLIGAWRLEQDAKDNSGNHLDAINHGVEFGIPAGENKNALVARFGGRNEWLEVANTKSIQLGTGDFSISLWIHTDPGQLDQLGSLVSQFDPETRRGFSLELLTNTGVTTNQANVRQLHFGIDQGRIDSSWTDHGRLGEAIIPFALAVHDGELYAGTCEAGADQAGHVFRWKEGGTWIDCGSPDPCNSVTAMAVFQGKLYVGVSKYRLAGSSLAESENKNLGGKVYRYDGEQNWTFCGQLDQAEAVGGLVVYGDHLFATSLYRPAGFFRYDGQTNWTALPVPDGKRVESMTVFNDQLFATSYDLGHVYRFDGKTWTDCGQVGDEINTQTYSFAVYQGQLYVGTWRSGKVFRYVRDQEWQDVGQLGNELEVMGMAVFNGKLYAGTLPLAEVYRFDGDQNWTRVGQLDQTPDVRYRRAWSMAEFRGRLFCGTLPSGKIHSLTAGVSTTYDGIVEPGWRHIVACRHGGYLQLYLDGKLVAQSEEFSKEQYDLTSDVPLKIGFGPNDYFRGKMADLRLYRHALKPGEVERLAVEFPE